MDELTELEAELLQACREDYVGLWVIVWYLERLDPPIDPSEMRERTLQIVRKLLSQPDMRIGQFTQIGEVVGYRARIRFDCWDTDIEAVIARIDKEWEQLGRPPIIGDIAWLAPDVDCSHEHNAMVRWPPGKRPSQHQSTGDTS